MRERFRGRRASLIDRLTDDDPDESVEDTASVATSDRTLRELVRRDLGWLLNTTCMASLQALDEYPEASTSVLNYGVPALSGRTRSGIAPDELERYVREAIWSYEPRLLRRTVKVRIEQASVEHGNTLIMFIEADLWSQPLPIPVCLRTEINLESGSVRVEDAAREKDI